MQRRDRAVLHNAAITLECKFLVTLMAGSLETRAVAHPSWLGGLSGLPCLASGTGAACETLLQTFNSPTPPREVIARQSPPPTKSMSGRGGRAGCAALCSASTRFALRRCYEHMSLLRGLLYRRLANADPTRYEETQRGDRTVVDVAELQGLVQEVLPAVRQRKQAVQLAASVLQG